MSLGKAGSASTVTFTNVSRYQQTPCFNAGEHPVHRWSKGKVTNRILESSIINFIIHGKLILAAFQPTYSPSYLAVKNSHVSKKS
jgi:hypothetical protein